MATAFRRHLGNGKAGDIKAHWPSLATVVAWVLDAGGVAALAHPLRYGLTRRKRGQLLDDFHAAGGQAAELVSGFQNLMSRVTWRASWPSETCWPRSAAIFISPAATWRRGA